MNEQSNLEKPKPMNVGYGNPPEHSRFKAGKSGNRRGRPKGTLNMATLLERTLREQVVVIENGKKKTVTKLEVAIKQLIDKAASGELKAFAMLTTLVRSAEERESQTHAPISSLEEVDEKVVQGILKRLEITRRGPEDETDTE